MPLGIKSFLLYYTSRSKNNWFILEKWFVKIGVLKPVTVNQWPPLFHWFFALKIFLLLRFPISLYPTRLYWRLKNWKMSLALIGPLLGVISKVIVGIGPRGWSSPHDSDSCFTPCSINPAANGLNQGNDSTGLPGGSWGTERLALVSDCVLYESSVACRHPRGSCSSSKSWAEWR